jgi:hypothetical protein
MKKLIYPTLLLFIISSLFMTSCKKDKDEVVNNTGNNNPTNDSATIAQISLIIPPEYLDSLTAHGFQLRNGNTPPNIVGIYKFDPICDYDNSGLLPVGNPVFRMNLQVESQTGTSAVVYFKGLVELDGIDTCASQVITGTNNDFTMYAKFILTSVDPSPTVAYLITATKAPNGLMNPRGGFVMVDDNGNSDVMPTGSVRIFHDLTNIAENISVFKQINPANNSLQSIYSK